MPALDEMLAMTGAMSTEKRVMLDIDDVRQFLEDFAFALSAAWRGRGMTLTLLGLIFVGPLSGKPLIRPGWRHKTLQCSIR